MDGFLCVGAAVVIGGVLGIFQQGEGKRERRKKGDGGSFLVGKRWSEI